MPLEEGITTSYLSKACLQCLSDISGLIQKNTGVEKEFGITHSALYDELVRFKIWADSIGALQPENSSVSLTQRLKKAPRAAGEILELLKDLKETLVDGRCGPVIKAGLALTWFLSIFYPRRRAR